MGIEIAIFNGLLYLSAFIIYWRKHKSVDLYSSLIGVYMVVAILGCALIYTGKLNYDLSILNFIYLFICVMLFIWPFKYARFTASNISITENRGINILLIIYFVAGCIALYYSIPRAIALAALDNWSQIRNELYNNAENVEYYGSAFEKLAKNIYNYLSPFGIVMAFYQLTKKKINILLTIAIFFVWCANSYCDSTVVASRGMIIKMAIQMLLIFLIFKNSIPRKRKKYMFITACGIIVFFTGYIIAISQSRFGDDSGDSTLYYLGHSMLTFNQDIMTPIHDYGYGRYFFKGLCPIFGVDPNLNLASLGCTHGTAFMTFVGCFFIDFGPIGTIILGLLISVLLYQFTKKNRYYLSDIIVIAYFSIWYLNGVFVVGRNQSLLWLMLFVVYFIVRTIETRKVTHI